MLVLAMTSWFGTMAICPASLVHGHHMCGQMDWPTVTYTKFKLGWYFRVGPDGLYKIKFILGQITAAGSEWAQIHGLPFHPAIDGTTAASVPQGLVRTVSVRGLTELPTLQIDGGGRSVIAVRTENGALRLNWQIGRKVYTSTVTDGT